MKDEDKTREQLLKEIAEMRRQIIQLQKLETRQRRAEEELRDITERKQAEEALRESEEKYHALFETAKDAIFLSDKTGRFVDVNQAACESLGYSREELLKLSNREIDADPKGYEAFLKVRNGPLNGMTFEVNQRRKDGSILPVEITGNFFTIGDQRIALAIVRDITERKRAEKEREQLRETEKVNQELKDFAYIVSHDLKAPLRAISSLAQWITEDYTDKLDDTGKEELNLLLKRTRHMHNMIDAILQYSRASCIKSRPKTVETRRLVEEVIESLSPPKNVQFRIEETLPKVTIDPVQIDQVFQNLIGNAVKFMDKPDGVIEVACRDLDSFWEFCVKDNGPGIEERHFKRIFQIFQRLQREKDSDSTGIGLTIVKKIVEQNGGKVTVESEPGRGSAFRFMLPKN